MAGESGPASDRAVVGLAREVEALGRRLELLGGLPRRVEELADIVARLAEHSVASLTVGELTDTWLEAPAEDVSRLLRRLLDWLGAVYLRYSDGERGLPACWLWHPDVVEELVWLRQAWLAAYADPNARVSLAADWHDRLRPGVVRRIRQYAGMCSIEAHAGTPGAPAPAAPLAGATELIASWWATDRLAAPPQPAESEVGEANQWSPPVRGGAR